MAADLQRPRRHSRARAADAVRRLQRHGQSWTEQPHEMSGNHRGLLDSAGVHQRQDQRCFGGGGVITLRAITPARTP